MRPVPLSLALAATLGVGACAVAPPSGPSVMALPAQGKPFEVFQQDDSVCRGFATQQTGGVSASQAATNSAVGSAVVGTALGAGVGAALGSVGGAAGAGAAIGGATGLLAGSAIGANNAQVVGGNVQQRYDVAYTQCMYSKGNSVQSAPSGYAGYPGPYPYPYPAAYPYPYYPYAYGPSVAIGVGGGWGWGGGGWHRHW
ncbi:MAG: glycine zipper family protein [Acetobacteraceae bacterium]|nr:glycine zipper family protein [Acetobacteraceae bacterium]